MYESAYHAKSHYFDIKLEVSAPLCKRDMCTIMHIIM